VPYGRDRRIVPCRSVALVQNYADDLIHGADPCPDVVVKGCWRAEEDTLLFPVPRPVVLLRDPCQFVCDDAREPSILTAGDDLLGHQRLCRGDKDDLALRVGGVE
jgi:hypothetical protein